MQNIDRHMKNNDENGKCLGSGWEVCIDRTGKHRIHLDEWYQHNICYIYRFQH